MRKTFALLLLFLLIVNSSTTAQVHPPRTETVTVVNYANIQASQPLVLINSTETAMDAFLLEPDNIASIEMFKDENAIKRFGNKGRNGVIAIKLLGDLKLANLQEVYDHFNIPKDQRQLQLTINDKIVSDKELLLVDIRLIEKVEVKTQDITAITRFSFDEDKPYLNIVTK